VAVRSNDFTEKIQGLMLNHYHRQKWNPRGKFKQHMKRHLKANLKVKWFRVNEINVKEQVKQIRKKEVNANAEVSYSVSIC